MYGLANPAISLIVVILIGVAAGWLAHHYLRGSWLSNKLAGPRRALLTSALVGVAGSFVGYHLSIILALGGRGSLVPFISTLNGIRRTNAALRINETLQFHSIDNPNMIAAAIATKNGSWSKGIIPSTVVTATRSTGRNLLTPASRIAWNCVFPSPRCV